MTGKSGRRRVQRPDHGALCAGCFPFVPPHPLATPLLPGKLFMAQSTSFLDLWLPVRSGQWEAPARTQRADVFIESPTSVRAPSAA